MSTLLALKVNSFQRSIFSNSFSSHWITLFYNIKRKSRLLIKEYVNILETYTHSSNDCISFKLSNFLLIRPNVKTWCNIMSCIPFFSISLSSHVKWLLSDLLIACGYLGRRGSGQVHLGHPEQQAFRKCLSVIKLSLAEMTNKLVKNRLSYHGYQLSCYLSVIHFE